MTTLFNFFSSKRKARERAQERKAVEQADRDLQRIHLLATRVKSEAELDVLLSAIPDGATRAATKTLIEPFCLFTFRHVEIPDGFAVMDALYNAKVHPRE